MLLVAAYLDELLILFRALKPRTKLLVGMGFVMLAWWMLRLVIWLSSGTPAYAIDGAVTYNGNPVPVGAIVFDPIADGQRREALIKDGRYSLPAKSGLARDAEYVVRVRAFRKTGRKYENADPAASFDEYEQYLPERYYSDSGIRLKATRRTLAKDFDVAVTSGSSP